MECSSMWIIIYANVHALVVVVYDIYDPLYNYEKRPLRTVCSDTLSIYALFGVSPSCAYLSLLLLFFFHFDPLLDGIP